jgi:hypothetical protein
MADTTFELISLCPAEPGWRAVFSDGNGSIAQVVAWGVFRRWRDGEDLGTAMEGIVGNVQPGGPVRSFECVANTSGFEGYLPPGMAGPSHG